MICNKCKQNKPTTEYYTHKNGKFRKICKKCSNESNTRRILANREKEKKDALIKVVKDESLCDKILSRFRLTLKK